MTHCAAVISDPNTAGSPASEAALRWLIDLEGFLLGFRSLAEVFGIDPQELEHIAELGDVQLAAGRPAQARELYEGCLVLDSTDPTLFCRLGTCHSLLGHPGRARLCFTAARELSTDPHLAAALQELEGSLSPG